MISRAIRRALSRLLLARLSSKMLNPRVASWLRTICASLAGYARHPTPLGRRYFALIANEIEHWHWLTHAEVVILSRKLTLPTVTRKF